MRPSPILLRAPERPLDAAARAHPELAAIILLEHALEVVRQALLAEHPALIDDFRRPDVDGPVLSLANTICLRTPALQDTLRRYRRAVRLATAPIPQNDDADDVTF